MPLELSTASLLHDEWWETALVISIVHKDIHPPPALPLLPRPMCLQHGQGGGNGGTCTDGDADDRDIEAADDESYGAEQVCQDAPRRPQGLTCQL